MALSRLLEYERSNLDWEMVRSSNLHSVAFVKDFGRLWVRFKDARGAVTSTYLYEGVPTGVYRGLMAAASKGKYHAANIARGGYAYTPVS